MIYIHQTVFRKLNFEFIPKKCIFRFLPNIFESNGWSWKKFFASFQILGPLGYQGGVVLPQNVKKSQIHCTLLHNLQPIWNITLVKPNPGGLVANLTSVTQVQDVSLKDGASGTTAGNEASPQDNQLSSDGARGCEVLHWFLLGVHPHNVRFQNIRFKTSGFINVRTIRFTKHQVYKMLG